MLHSRDYSSWSWIQVITHLITKSLVFLRVFRSGCYSEDFHSSKCLVNLWVPWLLSRLAVIICFTSWNLLLGCVGRHLESNQLRQHSTCSCSLCPKRVFWLWLLRGGISGTDGSKNTWGVLKVFMENTFLNFYWEVHFSHTSMVWQIVNFVEFLFWEK